jgi:uncharacterized membrane-anchored protein YitT (DUF2179 family)
MKNILREIKDAVLIILAIFSVAMGLKGFLLSSNFIDGGVTGISMLIAQIFGFSLSVMILIFNLPFIALGYKQIGKKFALKSALAIIGLSVCLEFVKFPDVTPDLLLTAVFGGFFIGAGIGLAIRGGAVLDGTEVAALLVSKNSHLFKVGDVILVLNVFIFLTAAFFLNIEVALYSILTYVAAAKTADFILYGIEEYTAITIVSEKSDEIKSSIIRDLNRSVTVYQGRRGISDRPQDILYCVVTRLEIGNVQTVVKEIDRDAFITIHPLAEVKGGMIKKTGVH